MRSSAANSWASLDFLPALPNCLCAGRDAACPGGEGEWLPLPPPPPLGGSSVFSRLRELERWGPCPWPEPFSGTVICCVGGGWPCTEAGRSPLCPLPLRRSSLARNAEYESGLAVKDCERFLRGLSSKNSMTKACWLGGSGCGRRGWVGEGTSCGDRHTRVWEATGDGGASLGGDSC